MASWLPSLQGLANSAWHAASYANPWAYGDTSAKTLDPQQALVPHERPIPNIDGIKDWIAIQVGQTAAPVFVTEAEVISIKRDGNCLYSSMIACIKKLPGKGITTRQPIKGQLLMSTFIENGIPKCITILRTAVSEYITEKCTSETRDAILDPELCYLLDTTIRGHNMKVDEDYKTVQDSLDALRKMGMDVGQLQADLQQETVLKMIPEGQAGYELYASKVLNDGFWGGYAEVYALSQLLGVEVRVFSDVVSAGLEEGALQPSDINRIHAFTASSYPKETEEEKKIVLYVRFDPNQGHFDVLDV